MEVQMILYGKPTLLTIPVRKLVLFFELNNGVSVYDMYSFVIIFFTISFKRSITIECYLHWFLFIGMGIIHFRRGVCSFRELLLFQLPHEYFYLIVN